MVFPPVALILKKVIIRRFISSGALSPETAKTPAEAGVFAGGGLIFSRLEARGVLVPTHGGRYYVDTSKI